MGSLLRDTLLLLLVCVVASSIAKPKSAKLKPCSILAINGFAHNEWINSWLLFWRHNVTCSDKARRCYSKSTEPLVWVAKLRRALYWTVETYLGPGVAAYMRNTTAEGAAETLAFMKWHAGSWLITSSGDDPSNQVYARRASSRKRPPTSGVWEVYNGSAMVDTNSTVTCIDGTTWLRAADISVLIGPYALGALVAVLLVLSCLPSPRPSAIKKTQ